MERFRSLSAVIIILALAGTSLAQEGKDPAKSRPTISAAERALAMWEIQNTMSKHAYYHAAGMHIEELADIWVDADGFLRIECGHEEFPIP